MTRPEIGQMSWEAYGFTHITTNATTAVKTGPGLLGIITINTKGATANTATVYDSLAGSGTVIAVLDTTVAAQSFFYNVVCNIGITVVTATGTAADITVSWT